MHFEGTVCLFHQLPSASHASILAYSPSAKHYHPFYTSITKVFPTVASHLPFTSAKVFV